MDIGQSVLVTPVIENVPYRYTNQEMACCVSFATVSKTDIYKVGKTNRENLGREGTLSANRQTGGSVTVLW